MLDKGTGAAAALSNLTFWGLTLAEIEVGVRIVVGVLTAVATIIWIIKKLRET